MLVVGFLWPNVVHMFSPGEVLSEGDAEVLCALCRLECCGVVDNTW